MAELFPLRPLQVTALDGLRSSLRKGNKRVIIQAPTGYGKTVLGAHIVAGALAKRNRAAFAVPMLNLIDQTFERFTQNGIDAADMGVVQGNHPWRRPHAPVQICSVQTVGKRGFPDVDLVVVDEVHLRFKAVDDWIAECPNKIFVGLSATPWSKGLADHWDDLIVPTTIGELIECGDLSKFRVFAPAHPDLSGIKIVAGDYHEGQLSERMSSPELVGDVVTTWLDRAGGEPTLVFAVDRAHAAAIHEAFEGAGISSAYVDANTPREERLALAKRFQEREIAVICSVGTMTTGVDLDVRCIVLARPTKSEILFVQMVGRGLRTAPGKDTCTILDHSDTTLRLGMVTDIHHAKLLSGKRDDPESQFSDEKKAPTPIECAACTCLIPVGAPECPHCGMVPKRKNKVVTVDGELVELGANPKAGTVKSGLAKQDRQEIYSQLIGLAAHLGKADRWVLAQYKQLFGVWPRGLSPHGREPSMELRSWVRSRQIAWAKRKEAERSAGGQLNAF